MLLIVALLQLQLLTTPHHVLGTFHTLHVTFHSNPRGRYHFYFTKEGTETLKCDEDYSVANEGWS